jgi:hypothetical protein
MWSGRQAGGWGRLTCLAQMVIFPPYFLERAIHMPKPYIVRGTKPVYQRVSGSASLATTALR